MLRSMQPLIFSARLARHDWMTLVGKVCRLTKNANELWLLFSLFLRPNKYQREMRKYIGEVSTIKPKYINIFITEYLIVWQNAIILNPLNRTWKHCGQNKLKTIEGSVIYVAFLSAAKDDWILSLKPTSFNLF